MNRNSINLIVSKKSVHKFAVFVCSKASVFLTAYREERTFSLVSVKGMCHPYTQKSYIRNFKFNNRGFWCRTSRISSAVRELVFSIMYKCRSRWPRGLRRESAAVRLLGLWVHIPPDHGCLSLLNAVCCQVEVSASS